MNWISVDERLPEDGQAVLVRRNQSNWHMEHTLANGDKRKIWRWQACRFTRGKTAEEVEKSGVWCKADVGGNNLFPYV